MESSWHCIGCDLRFFVTLAFISVHVVIGLEEFCELDVFKPSCAEDEVILMQSAYYGRMALGKCITKNSGNIGCKTDVLKILDGFCSGRKTCAVRGNTEALLATKSQGCSRDVYAYLAAAYTCIKVVHTNPSDCQSKGHIPIRLTEGTISSSQTSSSLGSPQCPFSIESPKGRVVNLTLVSFPPPPSASPVSSSACYEVASIREGSKTTTIHKCLNDPRQKVVYLSQGGSLQVVIPHHESRETIGHFLIKFQGIGCSDPELPEGSKLDRSGNTAKIVCDSSDQSWELLCSDGKWSGEVGECQAETDGWSFLGLFDHEHPFGTAIVVGIGATLGVLIGGILLYIIIAIFKRCQKSDYVMTYEYTDPSFAHIPTDYHADKSNLLLQDDKLFEQNSNTWGSQRHGNSNTLSRGGGTDHSRVPLPPLPNDNNTLSYEKPLYNRNGNV